jgi:hypothetical protein
MGDAAAAVDAPAGAVDAIEQLIGPDGLPGTLFRGVVIGGLLPHTRPG